LILKRITTTVIILFFSFTSFGQLTRFAQLVEGMYFNVFERRPNKQIQPFIKKYFPAFVARGKNENAGWSYTLKEKDFSQIDTTMHSFSFTTHPLVKTKFKNGRIDFMTYEKQKDLPLIAGWTLFFSFDNYDEALKGFESIYKIFDTLSKDKIIFDKNNRKIAQLTNYDKLEDTNSVEIVLVKNEILENAYKVYFYYGRHFHKD
jgi:hypothetical protein